MDSQTILGSESSFSSQYLTQDDNLNFDDVGFI